MTTTDGRVSYARPAMFGELAVVFALVFTYDRIRNFAQARPVASAVDGARVLDLERFLHLNIERWLNLWVSSHETLAVAASWYYQLLHLSVSMAVLLACYIYRPDVYRAARNALVSISMIGLMVFWVFPVAPPRLLPGDGYIDTAVATGVVGLVDSASANPYAAMPSLHLAWAVWSAMFAAILIRGRALRCLVYAYPVVTTVVVMATANHYLLDAVAGAVLALTAGWVWMRRIKPAPYSTATRADGQLASDVTPKVTPLGGVGAARRVLDHLRFRRRRGRAGTNAIGRREDEVEAGHGLALPSCTAALWISGRLLPESDEDRFDDAVEWDLGQPAHASHHAFTRSSEQEQSHPVGGH